MLLTDRISHAWNAFMNKDPTIDTSKLGMSSSMKPDRARLHRGNEKSIATAIYNRIAVDAAGIELKHVLLDSNSRYMKDVDSGLNNCLTLEANIDQTGRAFRQDAIISMLDEGHVVLAPIDTGDPPKDDKEAINILTMRTAKVLEWYPKHVKIWAYNERKGKREEVLVRKDRVGIVENPFFQS